MQSTALRCAECGDAHASVRLCDRCHLEAFCGNCIGAGYGELRRHQQQICFSITAPTSAPERLVGHAVGGLGAAHQLVTLRAFTPELRAALGDTGTAMLVAGVISNDFPLADDVTGRRYAAAVLEPIAMADADYLGADAAFRWQPRWQLRWALGAIYKMPGALSSVVLAAAGVGEADVAMARQMLALRTEDARTHYHFMRRRADEPDAAVLADALELAASWFARALAAWDRGEADVAAFLVGKLAHMLEDSYSPAHTARSEPAGALAEVYWFGAQTDAWHSVRESSTAVLTPGNEAARRAEWCAAALRRVLALYVEQRGAPARRDPDEAARVLAAVFQGG